MIISHKHKFIFLKTRKTAGSSIEKYLYEYLGPNDICTGSPRDDTPRLNHPTKDGHVGWKYIENKYPTEFKNYFVFSVERNPWDKIVSFYDWYQKIKPRKTKSGFDNFVLNPKNRGLNDWRLYAEKTQIKVDALISYESLHEQIQKLPVPYNDELLTTFVKSDIRKNKDYKKMYTEETKEIIAQRFANVIDYFGYKF